MMRGAGGRSGRKMSQEDNRNSNVALHKKPAAFSSRLSAPVLQLSGSSFVAIFAPVLLHHTTAFTVVRRPADVQHPQTTHHPMKGGNRNKLARKAASTGNKRNNGEEDNSGRSDARDVVKTAVEAGEAQLLASTRPDRVVGGELHRQARIEDSTSEGWGSAAGPETSALLQETAEATASLEKEKGRQQQKKSTTNQFPDLTNFNFTAAGYATMLGLHGNSNDVQVSDFTGTSATAACKRSKDQHPGRNLALVGDIILDFNVWNADNSWEHGQSHHLVGAATPEDGSPTLSDAEQCAAVCAAWPKFSGKTGQAPSSVDVVCTGWTFFGRGENYDEKHLQSGFANPNYYNAGYDRPAGNACRLFSGLLQLHVVDFGNSPEQFGFDAAVPIESGAPCPREADGIKSLDFTTCQEEDFGFFLDWPANHGGASPIGGAMKGAPEVHQGNYYAAADGNMVICSNSTNPEDAKNPSCQNEEGVFQEGMVKVEMTTDANGDNQFANVPTPGANWEYLQKGPGKGYFLCMAWCRITPWCKAMTAGHGPKHDSGQFQDVEIWWDGCWMRTAVGRKNIYPGDWEKGAAVHSAFTVCKELKEPDSDNSGEQHGTNSTGSPPNGTNGSSSAAATEDADGGLAAPLIGGLGALLALIALGVVLACCCCGAAAAVAGEESEASKPAEDPNLEAVFLMDFGDAEKAFLSAGLTPAYAKTLAEQVSSPLVDDEDDLTPAEAEADVYAMSVFGFDFAGDPERVGRMREFLQNLARDKYGNDHVDAHLTATTPQMVSFGETESALQAKGFSAAAAAKIATRLRRNASKEFQQSSLTKTRNMQAPRVQLSESDIAELELDGADLELVRQLYHISGEAEHADMWSAFVQAKAPTEKKKRMSIDLSTWKGMDLDGPVEQVQLQSGFTPHIPPKKHKERKTAGKKEKK